MLLRACPSTFFYLRPLHFFSSTSTFSFFPSIRREFRFCPRRFYSFRRMESSPSSSSSPTPVTASAADSLARDLQNQSLGTVDEGGKIKRKLEEINWDHSFIKELPGDPRTDVISRTELYERNLRLLVPFLENASIELQAMEKSESSERNYVLATWKLRQCSEFSLKLPWRPLIAIDGNTVYDLDRDFKIVRHVERWNVSALQAIGQIFTVNSSPSRS